MQSSQSHEARPRFFYGYVVVIIATFISIVASSVYGTFGIFFNPILAEFGWSRASTSGAFSLSLIIHSLFGIAMGRLNDRFGPRLVLTIGGFLLGIGYWLMSEVNSIWQFYLNYGVIIGISMGCFLVPTMSTVARWFVKKRNIMGSFVMAGTGIGALVGSPLANYLISAFDWRQAYQILSIAVFVIVTAAAQFLKRDPGQTGQKPYGEDSEEEPKPESGHEDFTLREAIRTRPFWLVFGILVSVSFFGWSIQVHIAPHAIDLGLSRATAANILAVLGGFSTLGMVIIGTLSERIGSKTTLIIGFILTALTLFWLIPATEPWMLYMFVAVFGLSHRLGVLVSPLLARIFGLRSHGLIFGVCGLGITLGAGIGPFLTGYIYDAMNSYQVAFLVCGGIAILGVISTSLLRPPQKNKGNQQS